jgi:hypothetical protein
VYFRETAGVEKLTAARPPWVPVIRFEELWQTAFELADRESYRNALARSRGLRVTGVLAVLVGSATFIAALWLKEGGMVIAMTATLIAAGALALRPRTPYPADVQRVAEENLAVMLQRYRETQLALPDLFHSEAWQALRKSTLERMDARCAHCGRKSSAMLVVEHIRSRAEAPELALDPANVQIICHACRQSRSAATGSD